MSMRVSYIPGFGKVGYLPGYDKPMIAFGKEFVEAMIERERATQEKRAAQSTYNNPTDSLNRRELSRSELAELAAELADKYDPSNMTQEEYDSLLDDLLKEGILSKEELGLLGYHGMVVCGTMSELAGEGGTGGMYSLDTAAVHNDPSLRRYERIYGCTLGLSDTDGNAYAYARLMALMTPTSGITAAWLTRAEKSQSSYQVLADVLEAMQKKS